MTTSFDNIATQPPKRVTVIGAGKSGIAAVKYLRSAGSRVFLSDTCSRAQIERILSEAGLGGARIESEAGEHTLNILGCDLIILSPGVRSDLDILKTAARQGIPVWSEMELGYRVSAAPFLAVTGSSGKSTTVSLLASAMRGAGFEAVLAGNIGTPVISVTPGLSSGAVVVAEVSSFQLETIDRFKPKAAAVINLMKNHLDRYKNEEEYYSAKKRIAENLTKSEYLVLNANDPRLVKWAREFSSQTRVIMFGAGAKTRVGSDCGSKPFAYVDLAGVTDDAVYLSGGAIRYRFGGASGVILDDVGCMRLGGAHNYINACAAAAMALAGGAEPGRIGRGLCEFEGLPHRLEYVADIGGVRFYNDSKSTTAESIECAVKAFGKAAGIHLIAGGKDKGCDFSVISGALRDYVKSVTLIGEAKDRMAAQWKGIVPVCRAASLRKAVYTALNKASAGEKIIFSPGCSSFDMFKNFEHRGEAFRGIVRGLAPQAGGADDE